MSEEKNKNLVSIIVTREPLTYFLIIFSYVVSALTILNDLGLSINMDKFQYGFLIKYIIAILFSLTCLILARKKWLS